MISNERIKGSWNRVVGAVKEQYAQISGDELSHVEGNAEQLIGLIQRKTGKSREQINEFLSSCCTSAESTMNRMADQASQYASQAGQSVRENYDKAVDAVNRGYESTAKQVSKRPIESVAVALGAGVLAGLAVGLSMASRRRW